VSATGSKMYGGVMRRLRKITERKADQEPKWRSKGRQLTTGYKADW
jgi:hydrogenase small subunit